MVLKFNCYEIIRDYEIIRVFVSLICTLVTKACKTGVIFSRFSREGKREASERARYAR